MNKNYLIIAIIAIILIAIVGIFAFTNNTSSSSGVSVNANALEKRGVLNVENKTQEATNALFSTNSSDTNVVLVNNSGTLKLTNSAINKTGDTQTSGDDADFYGVNSAVLVKDGSELTIENTEITTNSKGSNGIFATNTNTNQGGDGGTPQGEGGTPPGEGGNPQGQGTPGEGGNPQGQGENPQPKENTTAENSSAQTKIIVKNVKITTFKDKSRGLDATFGGIIEAENVEINTNGGSSAAVATDRGEGNITVKNSILNTGVSKESGRGSPLIYSTGNITAENTKGTAYVSQIACIEGKNSIALKNCNFSCFGEGNRKDGDNYVDLGGIFIYQSMSGDAGVGTSQFYCEGTTLSIDPSSSYYKTAPMFHVTNTKANIYLKSSTFNFGSGVLFNISGQNQWGNVGSNGGDVNLTTDGMKLAGDIIVDAISSLNFSLKNTNFEGAINSQGNTSVTIDSGSTWTLTGDSNITSLQNNGKINLNGHKLYVNGVEYKG